MEVIKAVRKTVDRAVVEESMNRLGGTSLVLSAANQCAVRDSVS